jgi:hypothetical protein
VAFGGVMGVSPSLRHSEREGVSERERASLLLTGIELIFGLFLFCSMSILGHRVAHDEAPHTTRLGFRAQGLERWAEKLAAEIMKIVKSGRFMYQHRQLLPILPTSLLTALWFKGNVLPGSSKR